MINGSDTEFHASFDALEAAARRLQDARERINAALETLEGAPRASFIGAFRRRSIVKKAKSAALELERERLFLLECSKRFRGAQTRAVTRSAKI